MGAGIAAQARARYPDIEAVLGLLIKQHGNHVHALPHNLISFPTKHHWRLNSDIDLIVRSAKELVALVDTQKAAKVVIITRPGCGMGRLSWNAVMPRLAPILDDRFVVVGPQSIAYP